MPNVSLIDGHIDEPKKAVVKCSKENCEYFNEYGECSSVCINRGFNKIITNYDRIRNMTVEEMAKKLARMMSCESCPCYGNCYGLPCNKAIEEWLKGGAE